METAMQKMIVAIEKGYHENKTLWNIWKDSLLELEKQQLKDAFLCGEDAEFHYELPAFMSFKEYWDFFKADGFAEKQKEIDEFKKQREIYNNYPNINATKEQMAEIKKSIN